MSPHTRHHSKRRATNQPLVANPLVANPLVANPLVANPLVANPLVANPLVTNPLVTNSAVTNSSIQLVSKPPASNPHAEEWPKCYALFFENGEDGTKLPESIQNAVDVHLYEALCANQWGNLVFVRGAHHDFTTTTQNIMVFEIVPTEKPSTWAQTTARKIRIGIPEYLACAFEKAADSVKAIQRFNNFIGRCIQHVKEHRDAIDLEELKSAALSTHHVDAPEHVARRRHVFLGSFKLAEEGLPEVPEKDKQKLDSWIRFALDKFMELRKQAHGDEPLDIEYIRKLEDVKYDHDVVYFDIIITLTRDGRAKASTCGKVIDMVVPLYILRGLPTFGVINEMDRAMKHCLNTVLCHLIHEACHLYGAFHCADGLMSGPIAILESFENFAILDHLDETSARIVTEALGATAFSDAETTVDRQGNSLSFTSEIAMRTIAFLSETNYVSTFYVNTKKFGVESPKIVWDAVIVYLECGQSSYFSRTAMTTSTQGAVPLRISNFI